MTHDQEHEQQEKARQRARLIGDYRRVFSTDEGKRVLEDLKARFGVDKPAFIETPRGFDVTLAAIRDGQRQVFLHIEAVLKEPVTGDANIENLKPTVITE